MVRVHPVAPINGVCSSTVRVAGCDPVYGGSIPLEHPSQLYEEDMLTELVEKLPDDFFAGESYSFTYRFIDKNGKPMPNEFGYRVVKYLKTSCAQQGKAMIFHSDVNPVLAQYDRDEMAAILKANGEEWIPFVSRKGKAVEEV